MNTKNIVLSLISGVILLAGLTQPVYADYCTTNYGGQQTCRPSDLLINKEVQNPVTGNFVQNLSTPTFSPGADIVFQLSIQNISGQTFDPVVVNDTLPSYLTFVAGPGTYNSSNNTLTFTLNNLIAGETRNFQITAKVLPTSVGYVCVNNYAEARDDSVGRFDSTIAQFCIQTNVLGTTTLPVAGNNDLLLLLPFAGVGLTGVALLKKKS